jgi:putative hydrolase of the HAD superfamily
MTHRISRPEAAPDQIRGVLLDAGGVVLLPSDDRFAEVFDLMGLGYTPDSGPRALARLVLAAAGSPDPVAFWRGAEKVRAMADFLGLDGGQGERFWALLQDGRFRSALWNGMAEDCVPVLCSLRHRGYLLGLVSNSNGTLDEILGSLDIRHLFDVVLDSQVVAKEKPDAEIFHLAAGSLSVPLEECVFVGDDPFFDIEASLLAGVAEAFLVDRFGVFRAETDSRVSVIGNLTQLELALAKATTCNG